MTRLGPMAAGAWEPRWLEAHGQRLYAALHRSGMGRPRVGLVVAPPLLHELPRCRRLLTELASALAMMGVPCLRFDYAGSGDSSGDGDLLDFSTMARGIATACQALRVDTGAEAVAVMAVRASALAAVNWLRAGGQAHRLLLWEPVADGRQWLEELESRDRRERTSSTRYPLLGVVSPPERVADDGRLMGYAVSQQLRSDLAGSALSADDARHLSSCWGVLRGEGDPLPLPLERTFLLPAETPLIGAAVAMDASMFMTSGVQHVVDALGRALLEVP